MNRQAHSGDVAQVHRGEWSAREKRESSPGATTRMGLKCMTLSILSQRKTQLHGLTCMWDLNEERQLINKMKQKETHRDGEADGCPREGGGEMERKKKPTITSSQDYEGPQTQEALKFLRGRHKEMRAVFHGIMTADFLKL